MFTRRTFIKSIVPGAVSTIMLPHLARAASGIGGVTDGRVLVNTAIGPMWLIKKAGRVVKVEELKQIGTPWALVNAMPDRLYNRARVKAPMVRRDFLRNREKSDRTGRGSGDFVEVSWDDAAKLVTDEVKRVKETYGNTALHRGKSSWASNHARLYRTGSLLQRFYNGYGGSSTFFGNYSNQAVSEILKTVAWGGTGFATDWPVIQKHTKLMVLWGVNPLNTSRVLGGRYTTKAWMDLKDSSIETIAIDPVRSETVRGIGSHWVPIHPNTDTALALGMMHTLYTEKLHNVNFLKNNTHGFEEFVPYLTGAKDGVAKSAEWAAKITGIPATTIRELVRKMAKTRTTIVNGWSIQRQHHGEQGPWAILVLAAMLGQMGLPGGGVTYGMHASRDGGFPKPNMPTIASMGAGKNPIGDPFPIASLCDAYLNPGKTIQCKGRTITFPDIRLVYTSGGNQFTHHQDTNLVAKAFQAPETVIVQEPWWTPSARYADIVLPAASDLERNDLGQVMNLTIASHAAVAPLHQSRTDFDILTEMADRLGFKAAFTENRSEMEWLKHLYDDAKAKSKTVKMPSFGEFWEGEGILEFPMGKGNFVHLADFREDPLLNPLGTASGLIEITSSAVAKLDYDDCPAHPTWLEPVEWHGSSDTDKYPLQLISPHSLVRLHSQMCNTIGRKGDTVNEREPVLVNTKDAAMRGIKSGDIVRLFNGRGQVLAGAVVTTDITAGTICLHEGAWYDPDERGKIGTLDKFGSPNVLTREQPLSSRFAQATIAGTAIVQVEKYNKPAPPVTAFDPVESIA